MTAAADATPPLPPALRGGLSIAAIAALGAAGLLAVAMPALRQGRLLEAATAACEERAQEAGAWLAREPEVRAAVHRERQDADARASLLLRADDEVLVRARLVELAAAANLEVAAFRLGTARTGEAFDAVPATLSIHGDRAELPPFLETFYRQPRVVRLVSLQVETPEFGSQRVSAVLAWEYAAPRRAPSVVEEAGGGRWTPPAAARPSVGAAVRSWNRQRWERLAGAARGLRELGPPLRHLAALEAERLRLQEERRAMDRWTESTRAEHRAVLRKLPALLQRLDASALGRAALRPGPGGTLQIEVG